MEPDAEQSGDRDERNRPMRADASRNLESLLHAAMSVFAEAGVDAPMRTIAARAGVGVGTLYRHFPQRSDLIKAVLQREVDAVADAAGALLAARPPGEALAEWMRNLVDLVATKRGLGPALHSGDPAYQGLPAYILGRLTPALQSMLDAAVAAGAIRADVDAQELLMAAVSLAAPAGGGDKAQGRRMIDLLVDGLRFGATAA